MLFYWKLLNSYYTASTTTTPKTILTQCAATTKRNKLIKLLQHLFSKVTDSFCVNIKKQKIMKIKIKLCLAMPINRKENFVYKSLRFVVIVENASLVIKVF